MIDFLRDEIANVINNTESEEYCALTDEKIDEIVDNTIDNIVEDNELNECITATIQWYVNKYLGGE